MEENIHSYFPIEMHKVDLVVLINYAYQLFSPNKQLDMVNSKYAKSSGSNICIYILLVKQ